MSRGSDSKQGNSSNPNPYRNAMIRGAVMGITGAVLAPVLGPIAPVVGLAASAALGNSGDSGAGPEIG